MKIILWLLAFSAVFFLAVKYVERHNIFFPMKEIEVTPQVIGLPCEEVYLETSDKIRLHGWFIPKEKARRTLLFLHGNAGNISHRLEKLATFYELGFNTFIIDYRGYGKSEGSPSELGVYKDGDAAYKYLTRERNIPKDKIILYGESLGGAVAIDLAAREDVKALITEEAFTSLKDMAKQVYPFVPGFVVSNKFDSLSKIGNVTCQKLIIHSINDEIVPFHLGEKLFNAAKPPKELLKIIGPHNTCFFDSVEEIKKGLAPFSAESKQE